MASTSAENARLMSHVDKVLNHAKLQDSNLKCISQPIFIENDLGKHEIKLLEISDDLLDFLNNGKSLVIRGSESDFAVICTDEETYEIKNAETSNSLLLLPEIILPTEINSSDEERLLKYADIVGIHHNYLELRKCNPKIKTLKEILEENPYRGREYEVDEFIPKYTLQDLLDNIQCSEKQLERALLDLQACEINGFWRILDFRYRDRVLNLIFNFIEENSWNVNALPCDIILNTLEENEPREILQQFLHLYGNKNGDNIYSLDEMKICRLWAEILLSSCKEFNLEDFLETWKLSVPTEFTPTLEHLKGLAIVNYERQPQVLMYYPKKNLPEEIEERFKMLFGKKGNWTLDEITPYIEDSTTDKLNVNALLMKYARLFQTNGVQYFNAK